MNIINDIQTKKVPICVVGLGYVGLPLAILLAKYFDIIGFDIDQKKVDLLKQGIDKTKEVSSVALLSTTMSFTTDETEISKSKFIIVAVPTPVDQDNKPDLRILRAATTTVAKNLSKGAIVVYESTVYPGATEDECVPILEQLSGKKLGVDFAIGYSPERVNPGDKTHTIDKIVKVVAASDDVTLDVLEMVYSTITNIHRASSIKVAEAAKIIENTQRDINIALINELTVLFSKMDISVYEVLEAAGTKWNFLPFKPGLVGGHCIGVDPYYLTYKAQQLGHNPEVILSGRHINDGMAKSFSDIIVNKYISTYNQKPKTATIFGITFKENVPDIRNSKVADLYKELELAGINCSVIDPIADVADVKDEYGIALDDFNNYRVSDIMIIAVAHQDCKKIDFAKIAKNNTILFDLKNILNKEEMESHGIKYFTL